MGPDVKRNCAQFGSEKDGRMYCIRNIKKKEYHNKGRNGLRESMKDLRNNFKSEITMNSRNELRN